MTAVELSEIISFFAGVVSVFAFVIAVNTFRGGY